MIDFKETENSIVFNVRVIPRASKSEIVGELNGALKIKISAPPVDGAANSELIKLLSKTFSVSRNEVEILSGATAKTKRIRIFNLSNENFQDFLKLSFRAKSKMQASSERAIKK